MSLSHFSQFLNSFSLYILYQDTIGFNLASFRFIQGEMEAKQETFFADATEKVKKIRKKHKSAVVQVVKKIAITERLQQIVFILLKQ